MADLDQAAEFLTKVPLFRSLKKGQLQSLAQSMVDRDYKPGEEIVTQGEGGIGLYIVTSGRAEAVHTRTDGSKAVVNEFGPTDFFGELAVLNDEPRTASVIAVEPTRCMVLSRWEFLGKLRNDAEMAVLILQEMAYRFQRALQVL